VDTDWENEEPRRNGFKKFSPPERQKRLLDMCQFCLELENDRAPMFDSEEKKHHAYIHARYASALQGMTEQQVRATPKFQEIFKCCFEDGYYDEVKGRRGQQ